MTARADEGEAPHAAGGGGHETRDVRVRPIVLLAIGLALLVALSAGLMQLLLGGLAARTARESGPVSPLAGVYGRQVPPEPRLQARPLDDLRELRAAEDAALRQYDWVDEDAGIMRIPIERAIELLAERGLPARAAEAAP